MPFKIKLADGSFVDGVTDADGCALISQKYFSDKDKLKISFEVSKEYQKQNKIKA